jgi:hypothetical protein
MNTSQDKSAPAAGLHSDTAAALAFLHRLAEAEFWGAISFKLEAGRVTHIRQEENIKPSDLSGSPRRSSSEFRRSRG